MLKKLLFLLVMCPVIGQAQKTSFEIYGQTVKNSNRAVLIYFENEQFKFQSAEIKKGSYHFAGSVQEPVLANLCIMSQEADTALSSCLIALEPGKINVQEVANAVDAKVKGGLINGQLQEWKNLVAKPGQKYDEVTLNNLHLLDKYIQKYPDSYVGLNLIGNFFEEFPAEGQAVFMKINKKLRDTEVGKRIDKKFKRSTALLPGRPAPDFTLNDPEGNAHSLSEFRGNYVFLDFWASTCKPCRALNKHLITVAEKYKDRNFKIIGVSTDSDMKPWKKAIEVDKTTWLQLCELVPLAQNKMKDLYQVSTLPRSFLIDPDGNFMELRKGELDKKLEEIFKDQ